MVIPLGQHKRRAAVSNGLDDFSADDLIPLFVQNQFPIQILELSSHVWVRGTERTKVRRADHDSVLKWVCSRLLLRVDSVSNRTTLHEHDWMVTVLSRNRRRQAGNEFSIGLPDNKLKTVGGKMMTLIYNHVPVIPYGAVDETFPDHALHHRGVDNRGRFLTAASGSAAFPRG